MFLVKPHWRKLNRTVWSSLEKRRSAPLDMYIELLRFARRRLGIQVDAATDEALHDPALAREQFFGLPEPSNESKSIELLEGFHEVLNEFNPVIAEGYEQELREFIEEHNMRYIVAHSCKLELSIQGLLASQFVRLSNILATNPHVNQSLQQLEATVSKLKEGTHEERNCIGIATNLLEGIARDKTTNNQTTLGAAIEGCDVFPHSAVKECVKSFYKFASDYPNIRHSGTAANKLRELKKDDALLAVSFAIAFGSYVFDNDSSNAILNGEL